MTRSLLLEVPQGQIFVKGLWVSIVYCIVYPSDYRDGQVTMITTELLDTFVADPVKA